MQRIAINGCSGSGKSTLARRLSELLDLPYVELDSIYHGPGWTPRETFATEAAEIARGERWISEFAYGAARPLLLERADTLVWLDYPRWLVMWRVTRRTVTRRLRRLELWNGNYEGPLWRILVDDEHIIRWAWRTHREARERIDWVTAQRPELPVVRLRSQSEADDWIASLQPQGEFGRPWVRGGS